MDFTLSIANIEFLKKEISKSGLTYSHLRDDLIDHVCCDIEFEMHNGLPFEKAYDVVKEKIGIEGLERIQHETLYLIDKKYRIMKKTMKISGVIAPIILSFGALFKIMHWPGAGILMVLGFFLLSFVFLPSAIYVNYKEVSNRTKKWAHIIGFIGTFFLSLSFLFKIQHWPGSGVAMLLGFVLICLIFLPISMVNKLRDNTLQVPKYLLAIGFSGLILFLIAFFFKMMHWPGAAILMLSGCFLLVFLAFPIYMFKVYKDQASVSNSFIFIVIALIWFIVPTTLMSLKVSSNALSPAYETNNQIETDLAFIKTRNDSLYKELEANRLATDIKTSSFELREFIQQIKIEMIRAAQLETAISKNNEIDMSKVEADRQNGLFNQVVFANDKKDMKLKALLQKFEQAAIATSSNSNFAEIILKTTTFSITPSENAEDDLLISLNKLSFLQLNICLAEKIALSQVKNSEMKLANK